MADKKAFPLRPPKKNPFQVRAGLQACTPALACTCARRSRASAQLHKEAEEAKKKVRVLLCRALRATATLRQ